MPFSPFERASTRPKLGAMRYRYDIAQHFVTVAPPEHDDLLLLRITQIREAKSWNNTTSVYNKAGFSWTDLPPELTTSARQRIAIINRNPVLAAMVFKRKKDILLNNIIRCPSSRSTRLESAETTRCENPEHTHEWQHSICVSSHKWTDDCIFT